jgi:hypothetical protein
MTSSSRCGRASPARHSSSRSSKIRQRFRFDIVGEDVTKRYGEAIVGKFSNEIDLSAGLEKFTGQCGATVERRIPTYYRQAPSAAQQQKDGYGRLILPLWGNGRIEMLLAAIVPTSS